MNEEELEEWRNFSCILEVDLEYPERLHDPHNDYPLAPETVTVNNVEMPTNIFLNRNSHAIYQMVPFSLTLNEP